MNRTRSAPREDNNPPAPAVLMFGDTIRSPELRHEVPVPVPDPILYVEKDGVRTVVVNAMEAPRLVPLADLTVMTFDELGDTELMDQGLPWFEFYREIAVRACELLDVDEAVTPAAFPLEIAQYLGARGVALSADYRPFERRRRIKSEAEMAGIRKAVAGVEAALDAIRGRLRRACRVTSEELRADAILAFCAAGVTAHDLVIVSHGPQSAIAHEPGSGVLVPGEPVIVDLFPRDPGSGCHADMARTFCIGDPAAELVEYHRLCLEALGRVVAAVRPGVVAAKLNDIASDVFEAAGYATKRRKPPNTVLAEGFYHALGHGIGLEVHEAPLVGRGATAPLIAGEVLAIEPGLYRPGFGGCRVEDLVLVTENGCEVLTNYPDDLTP